MTNSYFILVFCAMSLVAIILGLLFIKYVHSDDKPITFFELKVRRLFVLIIPIPIYFVVSVFNQGTGIFIPGADKFTQYYGTLVLFFCMFASATMFFEGLRSYFVLQKTNRGPKVLI